MTKDILTETEVAKIEAFCADTEMHNAVRKVLLQGIYEHGTVQKDHTADPLVNGAFALASLSMENPIPDEELGAHIRAMWAGVNAMHNAFKDLNNIKSEKGEAIESPFNVAE